MRRGVWRRAVRGGVRLHWRAARGVAPGIAGLLS